MYTLHKAHLGGATERRGLPIGVHVLFTQTKVSQHDVAKLVEEDVLGL